jgi:hypothetical protein
MRSAAGIDPARLVIALLRRWRGASGALEMVIACLPFALSLSKPLPGVAFAHIRAAAA